MSITPIMPMESTTADSDHLVASPAEYVVAFTEEQLACLKINMRERETKKREAKKSLENVVTNVLIVEDQEFSRALLRSVFTRQVYDLYFHIAKTGQEAVRKYAEIAPDITYLDIELPDANGHDLAKLFNTHDPQAFLAMCTANNSPKDVEIALGNNVKGFIAKPFSKQKVTDVVDAYFKSRNPS